MSDGIDGLTVNDGKPAGTRPPVAMLPSGAIRLFLVLFGVLILEFVLFKPAPPISSGSSQSMIITGSGDSSARLVGGEGQAEIEYGIAITKLKLHDVLRALPYLKTSPKEALLTSEQRLRIESSLEAIEEIIRSIEVLTPDIRTSREEVQALGERIAAEGERLGSRLIAPEETASELTAEDWQTLNREFAPGR